VEYFIAEQGGEGTGPSTRKTKKEIEHTDAHAIRKDPTESPVLSRETFKNILVEKVRSNFLNL